MCFTEWVKGVGGEERGNSIDMGEEERMEYLRSQYYYSFGVTTPSHIEYRESAIFLSQDFFTGFWQMAVTLECTVNSF